MMTKESYEYCMSRIRGIPRGILLLRILEKILTYGTGIVYLAFLLVLAYTKRYPLLGTGILIPMLSFFLLSFFREKYNAKRPYEVYGFKPLLPKDTKGKSFPSRHVFSIYVIGSTIFWVFPEVGIVVLLAGVLLAVLRVVFGVHFPKDVFAVAIFGMICVIGMKIAIVLLQ